MDPQNNMSIKGGFTMKKYYPQLTKANYPLWKQNKALRQLKIL